MNRLWAGIPLEALHSIPQKRLFVYGVLLSFQGKKLSCKPSLAAIASRMQDHGLHMSTNAISKHISSLAKDGWIQVTRTGRSSWYRVYSSPDNGSTLFSNHNVPGENSAVKKPSSHMDGESRSGRQNRLSIWRANQTRHPESESDSPSGERIHRKQGPKITEKTDTEPSPPPNWKDIYSVTEIGEIQAMIRDGLSYWESQNIIQIRRLKHASTM